MPKYIQKTRRRYHGKNTRKRGGNPDNDRYYGTNLNKQEGNITKMNHNLLEREKLRLLEKISKYHPNHIAEIKGMIDHTKNSSEQLKRHTIKGENNSALQKQLLNEIIRLESNSNFSAYTKNKRRLKEVDKRLLSLYANKTKNNREKYQTNTAIALEKARIEHERKKQEEQDNPGLFARAMRYFRQD